MWWKLSVAALVGLIIGIFATTVTFYFLVTAARDVRASYVPDGWSSAHKEWPSFADWLRHGGRRLLTDAAFSAAGNGMTEDNVRNTFGPPDFVVVGNKEFNAYPLAHMRGSGGAYLYKVGRFARIPNKIGSEVFAIVFDKAGKVIYRLGFGVNEDDRLADVDTDTRSERRVLP